MRTRYLGLRVQQEVLEAIETQAEAERRTVSSFVHNILEDWFKTRPAKEVEKTKRRAF